MNVFAVIALKGESVAAVKEAVTTAFPENNSIEAGDMGALIADSGTILSVSSKIGIPNNPIVTSVLVVAFTGYYGRAKAEVWEWIKTKLEAPPQ